ncbi:MAG: glucosyl-3-phosphoglycerate synthase [Thermoplasmata archaeon]|nr:glucosyl-3-phosphoglycerate synthase [Thermoplasmata archaeon]
MDIKQEEIATLHEFKIDKDRLIRELREVTNERPVSIIIPMLYEEIKRRELKGIVKCLNKCDYVSKVFISLAAKTEKEFRDVKKFFSSLRIPKLVIWCDGPRIKELLFDLKEEGFDLIKHGGKGRDVWLALGIASLESYGIAMHDADIRNYTELIPTKLLYPIVEPDLDFKFNKGYYARIGSNENRMYGRVFRLFLQPLLRALVDQIGKESNFLSFLRSFRYPLSGEFALTSDLAVSMSIPAGWGIELGMLAETYRHIPLNKICQTDLGFYDHKHQKIGNGREGLTKMIQDILKTLLKDLVVEDHILISEEFLTSLEVLYLRNAQEFIRKYFADAHFNNLKYDRHSEELIVEKFSKQIINAGRDYLRRPTGRRVPDWLRIMSAKRKIREKILEIVLEENE